LLSYFDIDPEPSILRQSDLQVNGISTHNYRTQVTVKMKVVLVVQTAAAPYILLAEGLADMLRSRELTYLDYWIPSTNVVQVYNCGYMS
jgi:hypothetical protein